MSKGKLSTPAWILEGFDSPAEYEQSKGIKSKKQKSKDDKTFRLRVCPKCNSDSVGIVLTGEEGKGAKEWECRKCKWVGEDIEEKELSEDEFMKFLDEKGEEVA